MDLDGGGSRSADPPAPVPLSQTLMVSIYVTRQPGAKVSLDDSQLAVFIFLPYVQGMNVFDAAQIPSDVRGL